MSISDEKISQLLSSPENIQKIAEIAKTLSASGVIGEQDKDEDTAFSDPAEEANETAGESMPVTEPASTPVPASAALNLPDLAQIISGLNISPSLLGSLGKAARGFNDSERRVTLLNAMKPFTHGSNSITVDWAITALKIARAARLFMEK